MSQLILPTPIVLAGSSYDVNGGTGALIYSAYETTSATGVLTCATAKLPAFSVINDAALEFNAVLRIASGSNSTITAAVTVSDMDGTTNAVSITSPSHTADSLAADRIVEVSMKVFMTRGKNGDGDSIFPMATGVISCYAVNGAETTANRTSFANWLTASAMARFHLDQRVVLKVTRSAGTSLMQLRHGRITGYNLNTTNAI
jgi:hypothetical protein